MLGTAEYRLAQDVGYLGDHAGIGETSLMLYLYPQLVAIERLKQDPDYGQTDEIEKGSSAALGQRYSDAIVGRLARLARSMPGWDEGKVAAFVAAERALVSAQVKGWRTRHPWAAWERMLKGELTQYGQLLIEERFGDIQELAGKLI